MNQEIKSSKKSKEVKKGLIHLSLSPGKGKKFPLENEKPQSYPETGLDFEFIYFSRV